MQFKTHFKQNLRLSIRIEGILGAYETKTTLNLKHITNPSLRVTLQRRDRAQLQNPCDTKSLLSLLVTRATHIHLAVSWVTREKAAEAGISRTFCANVR